MKCPFCQQELDTGNYFVHCHNPHCDITAEMEGTEEMWETLMRTRKALDVAVDALKKYTDASGNWWYGYEFQGHYEDYAGEYADKAIEQITALEQNDTKAD